jgi:cytochrome c oxidase cbb3-type subunit 1
MSTIFSLVVSIQGSVQAQMAVNRAVHFSDWVIGHSHLAMLGFATFAAAGGLAHAWQRIPWARYNARAFEWSYWLLFAGVILMVTDLTVAGLVEARLWQTAVPWLDSVRAARPYWIVRTGSAIPIAAGFISLLVGFTTGRRGAGLQSIEESIGLEPVGQIAPRLAQAASGGA